MAIDDTTTLVIARILQDVPRPVSVIGPSGRIEYVNSAAVSTLGWDSAEQLVGLDSHDAFHHTRRDGTPFPREECTVLAPMATGVMNSGDEEWFCRRDGSFILISWWTAPIELPDGPGLVHSFTDITQLRVIEQAARERDAAEIRANEAHAAQRRILENIARARQQIARDLHDGAQQRLVALLTELQVARAQVGVPTAAIRILDRAIADGNLAIGELRELVVGIHPSVLTSRGLMAAIEDLAARSAIPTNVFGSLDSRLPEDVESGAYFLVAEALTNAVKHSYASHVEIRVTYTDVLHVTVVDDGVGGASVATTGTGIIGLADRVAALDGTLSVESLPSVGTNISFSLPVGMSA